jgi:hypothetical protein
VGGRCRSRGRSSRGVACRRYFHSGIRCGAGWHTLHIKDAEDRTVLAAREALEWVSLAEAENSVVLTSVHEDTEGLAWKIALHQDELMRERRARETSEREHWEH